MPIFVVHTNVVKEEVPQELYSEATVELAKAMRLPEKVSTCTYCKSFWIRASAK